jgi:hypothetical protein
VAQVSRNGWSRPLNEGACSKGLAARHQVGLHLSRLLAERRGRLHQVLRLVQEQQALRRQVVDEAGLAQICPVVLELRERLACQQLLALARDRRRDVLPQPAQV